MPSQGGSPTTAGTTTPTNATLPPLTKMLITKAMHTVKCPPGVIKDNVCNVHGERRVDYIEKCPI